MMQVQQVLNATASEVSAMACSQVNFEPPTTACLTANEEEKEVFFKATC
jgi:hypothetical protein